MCVYVCPFMGLIGALKKVELIINDLRHTYHLIYNNVRFRLLFYIFNCGANVFSTYSVQQNRHVKVLISNSLKHSAV